MKSLAVHHVALNVTDLDEALSFYTGRLGFELRDDRPDLGFPGAWLDAGAEQLHLIEAEVPPARGQHFAVRVEDIEAAIADLRAAGVEVTDAVPIGTACQAFLHDPSGNQIELHQVGARAAAG